MRDRARLSVSRFYRVRCGGVTETPRAVLRLAARRVGRMVMVR
jgi:hypothetical protein